MRFHTLPILLVLLLAACVSTPDEPNKSGDNVCEDECTEGEARCLENPDRYEVCERSDGCSQWLQTAVCTPDQTCSESEGCSCNTTCEVGVVSCSDPQNPTRCVEADGCSVEVSPCVESCDDCGGRNCEAACGDAACMICVVPSVE